MNMQEVLNGLTLSQIKELSSLAGSVTTPVDGPMSELLGMAVFIRTVTYHYTGRIVRVTPLAVTLEKASWIADSGRFSEAMNSGEFSEVEPYPNEVTIMIGSIVDYTKWPHPLPLKVK